MDGVCFYLLKKLIIGITKSWIDGNEISFDGHTHNASQIVSGVLSLSHGGTGVTSLSDLKSILGISNPSSTKSLVYGTGYSSGGDAVKVTVDNPLIAVGSLYDFPMQAIGIWINGNDYMPVVSFSRSELSDLDSINVSRSTSDITISGTNSISIYHMRFFVLDETES